MLLPPALAEKLSLAVEGSAEGPRAESLTPRDAQLPAVPGKAHAVIGMRRAGKTCFLRQLVAARRATVPPERAVYLSFDDDRLAGLSSGQLDELLEEFYRRYPRLRGRETVSWYLDEIQLVEGWDRFVRRVLDTENVELIISGSSAKLLSREIHSSLRGRAMATVIRPFSFRESLRHRGEEPTKSPQRFTSSERSFVEKRVREYLVEGGFPETQGLPRPLRMQLLQGYVDTVLFRDVVERYEVTQVAALRWIIRHALRNPAGSFSANRLYEDLRSQGHAVAKDSVHTMLGYLLDAFLISSVPVATDSERRRNTNPRKLYPVDPGMIEAFDVSGRSNVGHALETVVFNELERRGADIAYVKTSDGREVDFLARFPLGNEELIQVCADHTTPGTLDRELGSLNAAAIEHPRALRRLIVLNRQQLPRSSASASLAGVEVDAAHEWLLGPIEALPAKRSRSVAAKRKKRSS
ncbi:MAG: ATP-binding protein [Phycisphaerae bacterium]|nr:ATP-binding protein [Phycisphaerae bacterium]